PGSSRGARRGGGGRRWGAGHARGGAAGPICSRAGGGRPRTPPATPTRGPWAAPAVGGPATCRGTRWWRCGTATSGTPIDPRSGRTPATPARASPARRPRPRTTSRASDSSSRSTRLGAARGPAPGRGQRRRSSVVLLAMQAGGRVGGGLDDLDVVAVEVQNRPDYAPTRGLQLPDPDRAQRHEPCLGRPDVPDVEVEDDPRRFDPTRRVGGAGRE